MIRIVHVIAGLEMGGVQTVLCRLIEGMDHSAFSSHVISLTRGGEVLEMLRRAGAEVTELGMRAGIPDPRGLWRLRRTIARARPHLVQTWMYHSDLMATVALWPAGRPGLLWGIHNERLQLRRSPWHAWISALGCVAMSRWGPDCIVCASDAGRRWHARLGYDKRRLTVIYNGFDTRLFRPDPAAAGATREELGLPPHALLVGHVGRYAPQKDYPTLMRAAARVLATRPDVHFLLCGNRIDAGNRLLAPLVRATGHQDRIHLLGVRRDIARVTAALDVLVLSSATEAFPSCVGEAMASGVPVVSTAVGDVPNMVGDTGVLVPPGDPVALADGLSGMLARPPEERRRLGALARRRIEVNYGLDQMVRAYERCYRGSARAWSDAAQTQYPIIEAPRRRRR